MPLVVAVVGATASGKSKSGLQLAERFNGEIISADAFQVYRGFDIGTAKPTKAERARIKHHLIDILAPDEAYNVARFVKDATAAINDIHARYKLPILVGGSGQYIKALTAGWQIPKIPADPQLRAKLEDTLAREGLQKLVGDLERLNPHLSKTVDTQNPRRVIRALERTLGDEGNAVPSAPVPPAFKTLFIGISVPRPKLHVFAEQRIRDMVECGWVDEVKMLLGSGVAVSAPAMVAVGYRELAQHIAGEIHLEGAISQIKIKTNQLIRHQNNWFKTGDENINWVEFGDIGAMCDLVEFELKKC